MTPAALAQLIADQGRDLVFPAGNHGDLLLDGEKDLTLRGEGVFNTIVIRGCEDIDIAGIGVDFTPGPKTTMFTSAVRVSGSSNIHLHDMTFMGRPVPVGTPGALDPSDPAAGMNSLLIGWPAARGLTIEAGSSVVRAERLDISGFFRGVVITDSERLELLKLVIHDLRTSPIGGGSVRDVLIQFCRMRDITPFRYIDPDTGKGAGDHSDFIHFWTKVGGKRISDLRILDNLLDQAGGYASTPINLEDYGPGFDGEIKRNTVLVANNQGMSLGSFTGSVEHNVMLAPVSAGPKDYPTFILRGTSSTTATLNGNTAHDKSTKPPLADAFPDNTWLPRSPVSAGLLASSLDLAMRNMGAPIIDPRDALIVELTKQVKEALFLNTALKADLDAVTRSLGETLDAHNRALEKIVAAQERLGAVQAGLAA